MKSLIKLQRISPSLAIFLALGCFELCLTAPAIISGPFSVDLFASVNGTTQNGGGSILEFTPSGGETTFASALDRPRGVAFDSAGNLFIATTTLDENSGNYSGAILKIASDGTQTTFANVSGPSASFFLEDLKIDDSDNVLLMVNDETDLNEASVIYEFAPDGTQTTFGNIPGQGYGLAFDSEGNLYAADLGDQTVYLFTPGGTRTVFIGPSAFDPDQSPAGLVFDRFGNLFVSTEIAGSPGGGDTILMFAPDGTESTFASGLDEPRGLVFDRAGQLFVAEVPATTTGDILKFAPNGTRTVFASGLGRTEGNGGAEFLTFMRKAVAPPARRHPTPPPRPTPPRP
jgi:DNA-binding beta-propeller fold protein YncE